MLMNKIMDMVHGNALKHGWWETDRPYTEILALIHSEWSEALEEYRAGRPMVWYGCRLAGSGKCDWTETNCVNKGQERCVKLYREPKPEGIAVELIDGVIRILDYMAHAGMRYGEDADINRVEYWMLTNYGLNTVPDMSVPEFVNEMHAVTARAYTNDTAERRVALMSAVEMVILWIRARGLDPEEILLDKHVFNKTRPYKHGKVC